MNTAFSNALANYVILRHEGTHYSIYYHFKRGSIAVVKNQTVTAGTQLGLAGSSGYSTGPHLHFETTVAGAVVEPSSGPCRAGSSMWVHQPPIRRDLYVRDFSFSTQRYDAYAEPPHDDAPRTGSYPTGNHAIYFKTVLANLPAGSTYRLQIIRPDGSVAIDYPGSFGTTSLYKYSWWWWFWDLNLQPAGTWRVQLTVSGTLAVSAPFEVGGTASHSPSAIAASIDPATLSEVDVPFCRVSKLAFPADRDYDIVRYRYQWIVGGRIVRDATTAALSDALPKGILRRGDTVSCTVTPSDCALNGPTATASAAIPGATGRRRAVKH